MSDDTALHEPSNARLVAAECEMIGQTHGVATIEAMADRIESLTKAEAVPREPTAQMFIAGTMELARLLSDESSSGGSFARHVWYAMYDAAIDRAKG